MLPLTARAARLFSRPAAGRCVQVATGNAPTVVSIHVRDRDGATNGYNSTLNIDFHPLLLLDSR